jgi:succinate dehydrogenase/fumarate reductase flavoprotein subunit
VRIVATDHFGPYKSEISLTAAIAKLDALDRFRGDLKAGSLHELMRCHEAMNIQSVAKIVAHAALARKESRFVPYHYRSDYPETNEDCCGLVVVRKDGEKGIASRFERLHYAA